jgi:UrcA family protein
MDTKTAAWVARALLAGTTLGCALLADAASAEDRNVLVTISVSAAGLDVRHASGAQELYTRIRQAARLACTRADRVGLAPVDDPKECFESAVGSAVRSANVPQLTHAYLANHTLREAAARGIEAPAQFATQ